MPRCQISQEEYIYTYINDHEVLSVSPKTGDGEKNVSIVSLLFVNLKKKMHSGLSSLILL